MADLENEKGWFQFRKNFVGHAHFRSREDTYLSHDSASKLPLNSVRLSWLSARARLISTVMQKKADLK